MSDNIEIGEETTIKCKPGELTAEEREWLNNSNVATIKTRADDTTVYEMVIDIPKLSRLVFEHESLKSTASSVEVDILNMFRRVSDNILTTQQVAEKTGRPKSSVSRALGRLVEKGKIQKVQDGVYKR